MPQKPTNTHIKNSNSDEKHEKVKIVVTGDSIQWFLLEDANVEKWGDLQQKKIFIDNAVKALIPFKNSERDRSLLKLHLHLEEGVSMSEKKDRIFFEVEEKRMGRLFRIYWNLVCLMALQKRVGWFRWGKNWGDNRIKKFYSEMWRNTVRGGILKTPRESSRLSRAFIEKHRRKNSKSFSKM